MNKLTLSNGWEKIDFIIHKNKIVLGQNVELKHKLKQILRSYFYGTDSEFRKENEKESSVLLDSNPLLIKRTNYFEINMDYSLTEDCKMGTKSIVSKYFETVLDDMELFNTINTLDILFESLSTEISENQMIQAQFLKMTVKQLLKLMKPCYIEEFQKDEFDISYEELILIQLYLINKIQEKTLAENSIVLVEIPRLTNEIYKKITEIKNAYVIVLTNNALESINVENYALFEENIIDFADQDYIYELFGEHNGERKTIEEVYMMINSYIKGFYAYKEVYIINQINNFSLK